VSELRVIPVRGLPEIAAGDDIAAMITAATELADGDVVVVAQKIVSKAEGRVARLDAIEPSEQARELARDAGEEDARKIETILREAVRLVRVRPPLIVAETRQGFICGSAGVDASNAPSEGTLVLLPLDPDASAERLRRRFRELTGADVAVIVSDSFGRPWRIGTTDVAIGAAGLKVLNDLRGTKDSRGYELRSTQIAIADELAGAAELVMGKAKGIPAAVVRGADVRGKGKARDLVIPEERDLFR
jgi:coenzyme F420-0:L-glutamate ligase/coenzyme F420-1:gamma-L-glutamate ligase